jgi:hypothetical protein
VARSALDKNGNPSLELVPTLTHVLAIVRFGMTPPVVSFFNNKGGPERPLSCTTSRMAADLGFTVLAADLDPQANSLRPVSTRIGSRGSGKEIVRRSTAPSLLFSKGSGTSDGADSGGGSKLSLLAGDLRLASAEQEFGQQALLSRW